MVPGRVHSPSTANPSVNMISRACVLLGVLTITHAACRSDAGGDVVGVYGVSDTLPSLETIAATGPANSGVQYTHPSQPTPAGVPAMSAPFNASSPALARRAHPTATSFATFRDK